MSEVYYWPYELRSRRELNSRRRVKVHQGVLIRIGEGVGCIHPWVELGDLPLAEQIEMLRTGRESNLIRSAKECARLDGEARKCGRSLFESGGEGMPQPRNHWLSVQGGEPASVREEGFLKVKLKVGPFLGGVAEEIQRWMREGFQVRLDANESVPFRDWVVWWMDLPSQIRDAIDWIEDPCPWGRFRWKLLQSMGVPLAADRQVQKRLFSVDVAVYKAATDGSRIDENALDAYLIEWAFRGGGRKLSVTSYMDHPVGQMWAAYAAGCFENVAGDRMDECGLLTHLCFEEDSFTEQIRYEDTRLITPQGTGLGFDDLLEKLPWKRLN